MVAMSEGSEGILREGRERRNERRQKVSGQKLIKERGSKW